jgi:hypothetical protein
LILSIPLCIGKMIIYLLPSHTTLLCLKVINKLSCPHIRLVLPSGPFLLSSPTKKPYMHLFLPRNYRGRRFV